MVATLYPKRYIHALTASQEKGKGIMSIDIRLDDNFYLDTDPIDWILKHKHIVKSGKSKGKETISTVGYYGDIQSAIHGYITHALHDEFYGDGELTVSVYYLLDAVKKVENNALKAVSHIKEIAEEWKSSQFETKVKEI